MLATQFLFATKYCACLLLVEIGWYMYGKVRAQPPSMAYSTKR
jgi:hypothetical protein